MTSMTTRATVRIPVAVLIAATGSRLDTSITITRTATSHTVETVTTRFTIPADRAVTVASAIRTAANGGTPPATRFTDGSYIKYSTHHSGVIAMHVPARPDTAANSPTLITLTPNAAHALADTLDH